ncbi:hypothetical protein ACMY0K_13070 [Bacteroides sp. KG121]|uniref:hypothetical protein n=1 Tax=Bacteroides sp. KG121 TaxID=3397826 RepID=UPI003D99B670
MECVYLGEAGASMPIATISDDSWWSARASETVTRIFPAAGYIYPAYVSGSGTLNFGASPIFTDGARGTTVPSHCSRTSTRSAALACSRDSRNHGFAVRLFSSGIVRRRIAVF